MNWLTLKLLKLESEERRHVGIQIQGGKEDRRCENIFGENGALMPSTIYTVFVRAYVMLENGTVRH